MRRLSITALLIGLFCFQVQAMQLRLEVDREEMESLKSLLMLQFMRFGLSFDKNAVTAELTRITELSSENFKQEFLAHIVNYSISRAITVSSVVKKIVYDYVHRCLKNNVLDDDLFLAATCSFPDEFALQELQDYDSEKLVSLLENHTALIDIRNVLNNLKDNIVLIPVVSVSVEPCRVLDEEEFSETSQGVSPALRPMRTPPPTIEQCAVTE